MSQVSYTQAGPTGAHGVRARRLNGPAGGGIVPRPVTKIQHRAFTGDTKSEPVNAVSRTLLPQKVFQELPFFSDPSDEITYARPAFTGERALVLAVLQDAISTLNNPTGRRARRKWLEARRWVRSPDLSWPFSFINICHALGFEPNQTRRRILAQVPFDVYERMVA